MRNATTWARRLGALMLAVGLTGTAAAQQTVTLHLNAASIPDTVKAGDFLEVRGAVNGTGGATLPDGNVINWDESSTIEPTSVGGDYWETSFQLNADDTLDFKFWSQNANDLGLNSGWETGANNYQLIAGAQDTTLALHFFNATGSDQPYDWRPWAERADSVAVWFRVFMNTESAVTKGYDPESGDLVIGLRGGPENGGVGAAGDSIQWGGAVPLARESDDENLTGYHLYSGVLYFPQASAGNTQEYKFYIDGLGLGDAGYEDGNNRTFTIPASDTTLHWVYFSNSRPVDPTSERVTANVIFTTDVTPLDEIGLFDRTRGDTIIVRGSFNGFGDCLAAGNPDDCTLFETIEGNFSSEIPISEFVDNTVSYKYYANFEFEGAPSGWEEPFDFGGSNRTFPFTGDDLDLGTEYFNNARPGNILPEDTDVEVTFRVNMEPATGFTTKPAFDPASDSVRIVFEDPLWIYTQTAARGVEELDRVYLEDDDGDMIYTGTFTVMGPTYNGIGYRYEYGSAAGGYTTEGEGGFDPGRRRYQYVLPGDDGSWPATFYLGVVDIQEANPMPFECNPTTENPPLPCVPPAGSITSVEEVPGELPAAVTLEANYPNPFNPSTTFEYTLDQPQHVRVQVFDVLGRVVATLVDAAQPAARYRVSFDAATLASGTYLYRLETPGQVITRRMTLVK